MNVVRDFAAAVLPFLFVLPLVVVVHELGHFLAAKAFGIKIEQFSINFGRALLRWRDRSGVEWRIGWLPLGGYVKFAGDVDASSVPDRAALDALRDEIRRNEGPGAEHHYFHFKPIWQRAVVTVAGPVANFLLAIVLFAALLGTLGEAVTAPRVSGVRADSAAAEAGFRPGDLIRAIDGRSVDDFNDVPRRVMLASGETLRFSVERDGRLVELLATPRRQITTDPVGNRIELGVLGIESRERPTRVVYGPVEAIGRGAERTWSVLDTTLTYLGRVVTGRESADMLSGPIGIGNTARQVADYGGQGAPSFELRMLGAFVALVGLAAVVSVGLGFMNLMPIPVLDGGHLVFYAYEAVARRPLAAAAQGLAYRVGLALILGFMLFATWNDLQRLRLFQAIGGLFS